MGEGAGVGDTYGSHLARRGVALKVIQELMGHATIEMILRRRRESNPRHAVRNPQQDRALTSQPPGMIWSRYPAASRVVPSCSIPFRRFLRHTCNMAQAETMRGVNRPPCSSRRWEGGSRRVMVPRARRSPGCACRSARARPGGWGCRDWRPSARGRGGVDKAPALRLRSPKTLQSRISGVEGWAQYTSPQSGPQSLTQVSLYPHTPSPQ